MNYFKGILPSVAEKLLIGKREMHLYSHVHVDRQTTCFAAAFLFLVESCQHSQFPWEPPLSCCQQHILLRDTGSVVAVGFFAVYVYYYWLLGQQRASS